MLGVLRRRAARDPGRRGEGRPGLPFRRASAGRTGDGLPCLLTSFSFRSFAARDGGRDRRPVRPGRAAAPAAPDRAEAARARASWRRPGAEAALARAQARLGIIPRDAAEASAPRPPGRFDLGRRAAARGSGNPVVPLVADLRRPPGRRASTSTGAPPARTSGHRAMLVAARTWRVCCPSRPDAGRACRAGARYRDTPMPGRTLGRQACRRRSALKAATGWWAAWTPRGRLPRARRCRCSSAAPPGRSARSGTGRSTSSRRSPRRPGWTSPSCPGTPAARRCGAGAALALTAGALGKIAEDVWLLSQSEVGEVAEPAGRGRGGSSTMPHKRNPALSR